MPLRMLLRRQTDQRLSASERLALATLEDKNHMKTPYVFSTELKMPRTKLRSLETPFQATAASTVVSKLIMFSA
jgi:hypothetical protein